MRPASGSGRRRVRRSSPTTAFHTATGGERKLTFPETIESVTELYSGKHFTLKDHTLLYRFETPDTALFELCTHNPKETIS